MKATWKPAAEKPAFLWSHTAEFRIFLPTNLPKYECCAQSKEQLQPVLYKSLLDGVVHIGWVLNVSSSSTFAYLNADRMDHSHYF